MKRLDYTKVSVKLKKSEWRDEWFIYLEAYPVYETGNDKPKRVREYLRRSITTLYGINDEASEPLLVE